MKAIILILALQFNFAFNSIAQQAERVSIKGKDVPQFLSKEMYKYPAFMKGKVFFVNGDTGMGRMNYNYFIGDMQFIDKKGDTLAMANEKDIRFITIAADTIFYDNGYYEWMASSPESRLVIKRSLKLAGQHKIGTFGISDPNSRIQSQEVMVGRNVYKLDVDEDYVFVKEKEYYIGDKTKNTFVEVSKKNILKLFPEQDKKIEEYMKKNKTDIKKEQDLVDLFIFLNTPA